MTTNVERQQQLRAQAIHRQQQQLQAQEQQAVTVAQKYDMSDVQIPGAAPPPGMEGAYAKPSPSVKIVAPQPAPTYDMSDAAAALQAAGLTNIPVKSAAPAGQALRPFMQDDRVDLISVVQSGNKPAINAATYLFGQSVVAEAQHYAKTPVTQEQWDRLGEGTRQNARIVKPLPVELYNQLPDKAKADYYIETKTVKADVAAALGPGTLGRTAQYAPSVWESVTPWKEEQGQKATSARALGMAADYLVPGAHLARNWDSLSTRDKTLGIVLDMAAFIPGVALLSTARRAGSSLAQATRTVAIAEAKAPITSLRHPIESAKSALRPMYAMLETAVHPARIPLAGTEIRSMTVRLPVKQVGNADEAMLARDMLMTKAAAGEGPLVSVGGRQIGLTTTSLQRTTHGIAVHATPDVRPFMNGAVIQTGREGGLFVGPNLHTRFTTASAFGDLPTGGVPGALLITDKRILGRLTPSGKVYRGTVEMEKLVKGGERLPAPSQVLFSRDAEGRRLTLLVIGEPLSARQVATLKFMGPKDVIASIFREPYKLKSALSGDMDNLAGIGQRVKAIKQELRAAEKAGESARAAALRRELKSLDDDARRLTERAGRVRIGRPLRPAALSYDDFTMKQVYREYARQDPEGFARWLAGHDAGTRREILNDLPASTRRAIADKVKAENKPVRTYTGSAEYRREASQREPRYPARQRVGTSTPGRGHPSRGRGASSKRTPGDISIERVTDIPANPGIVTFPMGVVKVRIKPPYRRGGQDVDYIPIKPIVKGKGSPERGVEVSKGKAPGEILLAQGITTIRIKGGKQIGFSRNSAQRGPGVLGADGKVRRPRRLLKG